MPHRLALVVAASVFLAAPRMAGADPITYNFTGELNSGLNVPKTLSGTLTFNTTPPASDFSGSTLNEGGGEVALTLDVGGQIYHFQNNPQDPSSGQVEVSALPMPYGTEVDGMPAQGTELEFAFAASNNQLSFVLTKYFTELTKPPADLASLGFPGDSFVLTMNQVPAEGMVTSVTEAEAPEPCSLLIFAGLGIAALAWHSRRGPRGQGRREECCRGTTPPSSYSPTIR